MEINNDIVMIKLDRDRELKFGHKALKQIKQMTGKSVTEIDLSSLPDEDIEKIMFAGLRHEDPELKLEQMEDLLDKAPKYMDIIVGLTKAFNVAFTGNIEVVKEEKNV